LTRIGIAITKRVVFRDSTQEFSNVYYYDGLLGRPSSTDSDNLIDQAANREKAFHGSGVTFIKGRCWEQTGDKATTEMISQKNLTGNGALTDNAQMDRERAHLFRLRAGNDVRGNPVYLRKWFHACANLGGVAISAGILTNQSGFTTTERGNMVSAMNTIGSIGSGPTLGTLCAKGGRQPTAGALWEAHKYLEHHQLGDMWRAN
jgi:hypothetical protein